MKAQKHNTGKVDDMTNVDLAPMAEYIKGAQERIGKIQDLFKTDPEEAKRQVKASWEPFVAKINKYRQSLNK